MQNLGLHSSCFLKRPKVLNFKLIVGTGPASAKKTGICLLPLHLSSFFILLSWTLFAHFPFEMGWTLSAHFPYEMGWHIVPFRLDWTHLILPFCFRSRNPRRHEAARSCAAF
jgi:hypothetical protein